MWVDGIGTHVNRLREAGIYDQLDVTVREEGFDCVL